MAPFRDLWFRRWFPSLDATPEVENMAAISVALCNDGISWQNLLIDLFLPSFPLGHGLMTPRNVAGELYTALLHKAYVKLKGSYAAISVYPTIDILRELTGHPWVCCYDSSCEYNVVQRSEQLQHAVEATLSRQRRAMISPELDLTSCVVVTTLGKIDNHCRAFRLSVLDDGNARPVLHDESGRYLCKQFSGNLAEFNRDQDLLSLRLSWEQLHALEPVVWSLSLGWRHERRLRQVYLHESGKVKMTVAISVPTLAKIAFSCFYSPHFTPDSSGVDDQQEQEPELQMSIAAVENDFSLTPLEGHSTVRAATAYRSRPLTHDIAACMHQQEVRTLSAGEYIVTISAERPGRTESHPAEEDEPVSDKAALTPASVDANLQLAFDCLDREGKYELSEGDIVSFLQLHERVLPSQHGKETLRSFLLQYGSSASPGSLERKLTLDDFREIYLGLSARGCNEPHATSESIRTRLRDLVWQDLLRLISNSDTDIAADINSRTEIRRGDIVKCDPFFVNDLHFDQAYLHVLLAGGEANRQAGRLPKPTQTPPPAARSTSLAPAASLAVCVALGASTVTTGLGS
ncbi:hypothetical protein ON010_g16249 [Phytophthora cinnamomi]|nr:hypothetical protein ON010_g16249 [Phytophthora cinnamomi]